MDLKSANVLLQDKNYLIAKIADLGLSRQIAEGSLLTNSGHGVQLHIQSIAPLPSASCMALPDTCTDSNVAFLLRHSKNRAQSASRKVLAGLAS